MTPRCGRLAGKPGPDSTMLQKISGSGKGGGPSDELQDGELRNKEVINVKDGTRIGLCMRCGN